MTRAPDGFFAERRPQAVFKHGILKRYPTVFASKTGWGGRPVVFLDGYAGRGEYKDGSLGSPALLAEHAVKVHAFRQVTGIYVEKNREAFSNLTRVMQRYNRPQDKILLGDVSDHLPQITAAARGAALFAFLDPFGTALDRDEVVDQLLCRPDAAPTEVLLHISITTVARLGGLLRRRRSGGTPLSAADQKTIAHVDRFLGGRWWQRHFEPVQVAQEERASVAALRVAAEYQRGICKQARCQAVSMPIQQRPGGQPKYVLVLFTRHPDGLWHFADALGKAGREWQRAWLMDIAIRQRARAEARYADRPALFDLGLALPPIEPFSIEEYERRHRDAWERIIAFNIEQHLAERGPFTLAAELPSVYGSTLGGASIRHVRAAVKLLHNRGSIINTGIGERLHRELIRKPPQQGFANMAVGY